MACGGELADWIRIVDKCPAAETMNDMGFIETKDGVRYDYGDAVVSSTAENDAMDAKEDDELWTSLPTVVDDYTETLDHKFDGKWDIWRTASKEWCVNLPAYRQTFSGKSLFVVLRDAAKWVPLPTYPRRPEVMYRALFEVKKQGNGKWCLRYEGYDRSYNIATKKLAESYVDKAMERNVKEVQEWCEKYGSLLAGKTEGVDFRWEE